MALSMLSFLMPTQAQTNQVRAQQQAARPAKKTKTPHAVRLTVAAGKYDRVDAPVNFPVPSSFADHSALKLTEQKTGRQIPLQWYERSDQPFIAWLVDQKLRAGESRDFVLELATQSDSMANRAACVDDGQHLLLKVGDKKILQYNHAIVESPDGIDPLYRRSGHIHPLFSPSGHEITGDFPPDHAHQHGIFFAWVNATFQGRKVDFWNAAKKLGHIEHSEIVETASGAVFAQFSVNLNHSEYSPAERVSPVLSETWNVKAYAIRDYFLIDLESRQQNVSKGPLVINEYHYGGMAFRGNFQWYDEDDAAAIGRLTRSGVGETELAQFPRRFNFLTSEGKRWYDGNATRAEWVQVSGDIDGEQTGVTILGHPDNFRAPQPVRLHPSKPYFCFSPMALGRFEIEPDETYVSRYRFFVFDGEPSAKLVDRVWQDYATPPTVTSTPATR